MATGGFGFHTVGVWLPYVLGVILRVGLYYWCRVITCGSHLVSKAAPPRTTTLQEGKA